MPEGHGVSPHAGRVGTAAAVLPPERAHAWLAHSSWSHMDCGSAPSDACPVCAPTERIWP